MALGAALWMGLSPAVQAAPVFVRTAALTLAGNSNLVTAAVDAAGTNAYFVNGTGTVTKVRLSDFTELSSLTVAGVTSVGAAAIDTGLNQLYFTAKVSGVVKLIRVNLGSFTHAPGTDQLTLRSDAINVPTAFAVDAAGHLGYVAAGKSSASNPAEMIRVNLSTFAVSFRKNATFPDDLNTVAGALDGSYFYGPSTTIYLSGRLAIGRVILSSLALDAPTAQPSGSPSPRIGLIDTTAGEAFFTTTAGVVWRVKTGSFPSAASVALAGSPNPASGIIDRQNRFLFVGTSESPGKIKRVDLATFAASGELTMNAGENNLSCAVYDSVAGYGYFGTNTSPARVVKVQLSNFAGSPPVNLTLPTLSGSAIQTQTLTGADGSWGGSPSGFARQWRRCNSAGAACVDIGGATGTTHLLGVADVGSTIRFRVTATNGSGSTSADSAASAVVQASVVAVSSLSLSPSTVQGGTATHGTVTLGSAAPAGGSSVALASADTAVASVPSSVLVAAGQTSAGFTIDTFAVAANTTVVVSATAGGQTRNATLTVTAESEEKPPHVFPNPYRPAAAGSLTLQDLPVQTAVKVVAADGPFVRSLTTDVNGAASWDGLTESGEPAPSGIYLVLVEKRAPVKIALQR